MNSSQTGCSEPDYTHEAHASACYIAATESHQVLLQHVLAKRKGVVYCGTIKAPYTVPNGPDCWTINTLFPEVSRMTVPCRNVIACPSASCSCRFAAESVGALEVTCL